MTATFRIGLRFAGRQARLLEHIAAQLRSDGGERMLINLFDQAADAARTGEPLVLICDHPSEAHQTAAHFALVGCEMPAIESLN